jgi:hypothetical protein
MKKRVNKSPLCFPCKMKKKGIMLPFSAWWLIAIAVLIVGVGMIFVLKDEKLAGLASKFRNLIAFRGTA